MLTRLVSTSPPTGRRARGVALLATLALVTSLGACDSGDEPGAEKSTEQESAASSAPTVPPTPSEELGLTEGWGPDRAELDRAARATRRMRLPDLAGQVIVAEWRGTSAPIDMVRGLHLGGVIAFDSNVVSAAQVEGVNTALTRQVRREVAALPRRGPGGRGGRATAVGGHPIPDLHERGRGRRHDPHAGGLPRQRRRAARPGLHRRLRPGRRRHLRSGRPHDRLAVALLGPGAGRRTRRRGFGRVRRVRRAPGAQALPRPRLRPRRQPRHPSGADPLTRRARPDRPRAVPRGCRGRCARGHGRPPRRTRDRPARAVLALAQGGHRPAARGDGVRRTRGDGRPRHGRRDPGA